MKLPVRVAKMALPPGKYFSESGSILAIFRGGADIVVAIRSTRFTGRSSTWNLLQAKTYC